MKLETCGEKVEDIFKSQVFVENSHAKSVLRDYLTNLEGSNFDTFITKTLFYKIYEIISHAFTIYYISRKSYENKKKSKRRI